MKVARTIADLEAAEKIAPKHLSEAIQHRTLDRSYWPRARVGPGRAPARLRLWTAIDYKV